MKRKNFKPRVVVDTNIFISGLLYKKGSVGKLIQLLEKKKFRLIISTQLFEEFIEVLLRPKFTNNYGLTKEEITNFLLLIDSVSQKVVILNTSPVPVRDPDDEMVLMTALEGKVNYLVTGDKDLLDLKDNPHLGKLKIVTVREFLEEVTTS